MFLVINTFTNHVISRHRDADVAERSYEQQVKAHSKQGGYFKGSVFKEILPTNLRVKSDVKPSDFDDLIDQINVSYID